MKNYGSETPSAIEKMNAVVQRNRRRAHSVSATSYVPRLLFTERPHPNMMASVIMPAKNEAANIKQSLDALLHQKDDGGKPLSYHLYEVLLLVNNCSDDTYFIAKQYQQQHPQFSLHIAEISLPKQEAHIGTARRLLMDEAYRRHNLNGRDGIILSTDSDTEVDERWIYNTLHEMQDGYDAIGGRILAKGVTHDSKLYYLQDITYRCFSARLEALLDPTDKHAKPCHFQCFGASIAVRCSAYQKAGRLPVIPFLEDEAFSRALYRVDARVHKSINVKVYTSSRLTGRVQAGLSVHLTHLGLLKKRNETLHVESLATLLQKWNIKHQLRQCWHHRKKGKLLFGCLAPVAALIHVSPKWLLTEMDVSLFFGEFWEKAEHKMYTGEWRKKQKDVAIGKAIADLRSHLRNYDL